MATFRELLLRLRPVGAPGAASGVAVPSDQHLSAEHELAPVFAELAEVGDTCRQLLAQAEADATRTAEEAEQKAHRTLAEAQARAAIERPQVAAGLRAQASAEDAALVAAAQVEAEELRKRAAAQLDAQVLVVVARVRQQLAELAGAVRPPGSP